LVESVFLSFGISQAAMLEKDYEERKMNFVPQKFPNLRSVPAYANLLQERFEISNHTNSKNPKISGNFSFFVGNFYVHNSNAILISPKNCVAQNSALKSIWSLSFLKLFSLIFIGNSPHKKISNVYSNKPNVCGIKVLLKDYKKCLKNFH